MKWIVLLLTVGLYSGCGPTPETPDFISWNGVRYFFDSDRVWDPGQINAQEDFLFRQLIENRIYPAKDVTRIVATARVYVTRDELICTHKAPDGSFYKAPCFGYQNGTAIHVQDLGCPFNSAVAHELGHLIQTSIDGWNDYRHFDFQYWRLVEENAGQCE